MDQFIKANKNLFTYSLIIFIIIPIFGINFFISLLGNIIIILFLVPLLLLLLLFIGFSSYKAKIKKCKNCGLISLGLSNTCMNCGNNLDDKININTIDKKPSESTIEIKAEEIT
jgi:hypothetical protein